MLAELHTAPGKEHAFSRGQEAFCVDPGTQNRPSQGMNLLPVKEHHTHSFLQGISSKSLRKRILSVSDQEEEGRRERRGRKSPGSFL